VSARAAAGAVNVADTNMFGGDFTPFRDIWQDMAGGMGITTKRMRESRLDISADQEARLRDANMALAEIIRTGSPEEQAIAAQRMRDVAHATSANLQSIQRTGKPQYGIPAAGDLVGRFYDERQQGRIASEADTRNKMFDLTKQRRDEFHGALTRVQDQLGSVQSSHDTMIELLNKLGAHDPMVQSRYRDLVGMSSGEAKGERGPYELAIHGLGHINLGGEPETDFNYDQIVKGTAAWLTGQTKNLLTMQQQLSSAAVQSGFQLDPSGGLTDVGVPKVPNNWSQPRAQNASDALTQQPTARQGIENAVNDTLQLPQGTLGRVGANAIEGTRDALMEFFRPGSSAPSQAQRVYRKTDGGGVELAPNTEPIPTARDGTIDGVYIPPALRKYFNRKRRPVNQ
jgi:hypothetical protein